jgi:hypothetical protein
MDDIEPEEEKEDNTVWLEEFAVPGESKGIGVDPNTALGKKFLEQSAKIDAGVDIWEERWAKEKAEREAERAAQEEESGG